MTSQAPLFTMDAAAAKAFLHQVSDDVKDLLANELYYRELDTIRREKPLVDPANAPVMNVALYDRNDEAAKQSGNPPAGQSQVQPEGSIPTTDPGNISMRGGATPSQESSLGRVPPHLMRVLAKMALAETLELIESGDEKKQHIPGPLSGQHIDIPKIREHVGHKGPLEEEFLAELEVAKSDFLTTGYEHMDQESMFKGPDWLSYLGHNEAKGSSNLLFKGFPMVEDVVFVKHPNYWYKPEDHLKIIASGQCYWLAIALLIYGNASFWLRVKAEHLNYVEKVLANPEHPRHAFYLRENQSSAETQATGPAQKMGVWKGAANLWERLHIPGCWTNDDMCQVTADVYGVLLVLYKFDAPKATNPLWKNKVYDMKAYGAYNNRHIFMCYSHENHFQPMVPNDFYAYEFKLPRLTLQNTKKYGLVTKPRSRFIRDGPSHHLRGPVKVAPSPLALPGYEPEHLARAVGYEPDVNEPQAQPQARSRSSPQPHIEPETAEKADAALHTPLLANPELLKSPRVIREVASLIAAETSGGLPGGPPTQADAQAARQAMRVIQQYIDLTGGVEVTQSDRHPLPRNPSPPIEPTPTPPRDRKGKRPATDPAGPSRPAKRLRTPPGPAAPPSPQAPSYSRRLSTSPKAPKFKPINEHRQPTVAPSAYPEAESSRDALSRPQEATQPLYPRQGASRHIQDQPKPKGEATRRQLASKSAPQPPQAQPQPQHSDQPQNPQPEDAPQNFVPATKTMLSRVRNERLKRWIRNMGLNAPHDDLSGWLKPEIINVLIAANVEVLVTTKRTGRGTNNRVVVGEEVEEQGVRVIRFVVGDEEEEGNEGGDEGGDEEGGEEGGDERGDQREGTYSGGSEKDEMVEDQEGEVEYGDGGEPASEQAEGAGTSDITDW